MTKGRGILYVDHIVSGCSKFAQKESEIVILKFCNFEVGDKWYEHELKRVLENEDYKIFWDFSI